MSLEYSKGKMLHYKRTEKAPSFKLADLLYLRGKYEFCFVDSTGFEKTLLLTQKDLPIKAGDELIIVWDGELPIAYIDSNREYFLIYPNTFSELHFSGQYNWRYLMVYTIIAMFVIGISAETMEIKIPAVITLVPLVFYSFARFMFVAMNARLAKTIENEILARFNS
ncbi:MAG: hypothetical protein K2P88_15550 [Chitinophagaceae bacterium]|uniref:hypothetical protein n=1 Tax=unclassified Paraflavitalea TaxID=2798305 RepID=UPI003D3587DA|nr:hypothetical protein [Chitinophagaceae bacterium]